MENGTFPHDQSCNTPYKSVQKLLPESRTGKLLLAHVRGRVHVSESNLHTCKQNTPKGDEKPSCEAAALSLREQLSRLSDLRPPPF